MSIDAESFLELAKKLRAEGATQVSGYGFSATFPAAPRVALPAAKPGKAPAKRPELPKDAAALRELQYAKELGK